MERHETIMRRALELAERGWGRVSPNPMVGALVVTTDGTVAGEGWYEGPRGRPHAERHVLTAAGGSARGATLYTTLAPCDHQGSTPPCTLAVIEAGIARVVVAATDPNPIVDGRGVARLREAGIEVLVGPCEAEAHRLNVAFERHVTTGRPFVVLKSAASFDGKTAAADGSSRWITSEESRADAQALRAWADAVAVGAGTALADDPSLTVRDARFRDARPPIRVVVDGSGRVPASGRLFSAEAPVLIATTDQAPETRVREWQSAGAEVVVAERDVDGRVSLGAVVDALGKRDVQGLLVEGGATLAWSVVRDRLVDRVVQYIAPSLIGGVAAPGILGGGGFAPLPAAESLTFTRVDRIGPDLRVEADVHRDH
jgi:diaminohydroxyphosphoribosylaminopyrimidine deaminase / 5-amino-6-(5-phosphoribosylamino)uracil reductase